MSLSVIEEGIIHLLHHEPYYAHLLMRMRRYKVNQRPGKVQGKDGGDKMPAPAMPNGKAPDEEQLEAMKFTAGVNITDAVNLYYNENWFNALREKLGIGVVAGVLKHEAEHITFMHLNGRERGLDAKLHNIAADCSINQYNKFLEPWIKTGVGVSLEGVRKLCENDKIEANQTTEYYYAHLQKKSEESKNDPEFQKALEEMASGGDDHSLWDEGASEEVAKKIAKYAVDQAVNSVGRGNVPGHLQKAIEALNKETLNWKNLLRQFMCRGLVHQRNHTRLRVNRRYGIKAPGRKKIPKLKIVYIIDTSGSMSDQLIDASFAEMHKMYDSGADITVIECDTQVHKVWEYKGKLDGIQVNGRGGTSFEPGFRKAAELNPDVIVYATDGDGESNFWTPKVPILWLLTHEGHSGSIPAEAQKVWMKQE